MSGLTAAVVGVILNLAIWFAWHALAPAGGTFDYFVAVVTVGAWVAMERFKIQRNPYARRVRRPRDVLEARAGGVNDPDSLATMVAGLI